MWVCLWGAPDFKTGEGKRDLVGLDFVDCDFEAEAQGCGVLFII
jgi:hypothetical protein